MKQYEIEAAVAAQQDVIRDREAKLSSTDYIGVKIAEGAATKTEYAEIREQRQGWRDEINAANMEIARLRALEPEEDIHPIEEETAQ